MVIFTIIVDRSDDVRSATDICDWHCVNTDSWFTIHRGDSYEEFWGASLVCFILGAYQIVGSMITYNEISKAQLASPVKVS